MYHRQPRLYHRKSMATIRARKKADGTVSCTVLIRLKKKGLLFYQQSQTFACKQAAQAWAKRRETELAEPGVIERANRGGTQSRT